jgi:hypothetical protein
MRISERDRVSKKTMRPCSAIGLGNQVGFRGLSCTEAGLFAKHPGKGSPTGPGHAAVRTRVLPQYLEAVSTR